jgi:hypothetical protein
MRAICSTFATVNHSCNPNVAFDLSSLYSPESDIASTWHLKSLSRPIKAGEPLTFFYPSTEWDMDRGFDCACGEEVSCLVSFLDMPSPLVS